MIPAPDLLGDSVRVGGPGERLRVPVVLVEVKVPALTYHGRPRGYHWARFAECGFRTL